MSGKPRNAYNPVTLGKILSGIRIGMPQHQAAAAAGVTASTFSMWIREREGVAEAVLEAEADFTFKHVNNLDGIAMSGGKNAAAVSEWMLERRDPATWGRSTRNDMWTREQQVQALIEDLKREGMTGDVEAMVRKEIANADKMKALPSGKSQPE